MAICIKLKNINVGAHDVDIIFNYETKLKKAITLRLAKPSKSHTRILNVFASELFEPQPIIILEQFPKLDSNKPPRLLRWSGKKYEIWQSIGPEQISLNWWLVKKYKDAERDCCKSNQHMYLTCVCST